MKPLTALSDHGDNVAGNYGVAGNRKPTMVEETPSACSQESDSLNAATEQGGNGPALHAAGLVLDDDIKAIARVEFGVGSIDDLSPEDWHHLGNHILDWHKTGERPNNNDVLEFPKK